MTRAIMKTGRSIFFSLCEWYNDFSIFLLYQKQKYFLQVEALVVDILLLESSNFIIILLHN